MPEIPIIEPTTYYLKCKKCLYLYTSNHPISSETVCFECGGELVEVAKA